MQILGPRRIAVAVAAAAIAAGLLVAQLGTAAAAVSCTPKKNIALILDDSGSMGGTDPTKLRVAGSKLLMETNKDKTFSAVDFGSDAAQVFAPTPASSGLAGMEAALDAQIQSDGGSTNYNAAFDKRRQVDPNADEIVFLTDGGHNEGDYAEGHRGGPRTDVIGFSASTLGEDGQRLARIASETGGTYYPETDASTLQPTFNEVSAAINCLPKPKTIKDFISRQGETKSHSSNVSKGTKSLDVVLTWSNAQDVFDIVSATQSRGSQKATSSKKRRRKPRKLKIQRTVGATFVAAKIKRVRKGKVKFKLRAKKLALPTTLVTQVTQSK